ncbi:hypothetical protein C475_17878 [Halosimplex carlsbadense 2-9-1]|uniref:ORC1/DEAH AAA+ ATPase domain-containing protein n=1 Tax=Halosimplex carlsbadense 2-9-1 TaxID=797114 RepID=M0CGL5_9EURY|nr:AAA family ATPase [Halosimplex carlsbadense]ELZ22406.1 hypothetical protein C475_17878 [Halosimplex carlsbadense 2-9-1]
MDIDLSEITAILGQKNSGKSVLFEHLLAQTERFICLDPNAEHGPPGAVYPDSPRDVLRHWVNGRTRQVIREVPFTEDVLEQYCRAFGQLQECYLYIDEAHNWMGANYIPEILQHLVKWHVTHSNCGLVLAAHKAKEIHDQIWTQTDNYIIFAYGEHEDSKFRRVSIPGKERVTQMDPNSYQFLYYKDVAGAESHIRGPVPIPSHLQ